MIILGEILKSEFFTGGQKSYKHEKKKQQQKKRWVIEYKFCTRYSDLPSDTRILKYSLTSLWVIHNILYMFLFNESINYGKLTKFPWQNQTSC